MDFNVKGYSIIMIIIGILTILFPLIIPTTISIVIGLFFIFVALLSLIFAYQRFEFQRNAAIVNIIFAIVFIVIGVYLLLNPDIIMKMLEILLYAMAIIMIVSGIYSIISGVFKSFTSWGVVSIIFGVLSIIVGYLFSKPAYLAAIVGLWILFCGILSLFYDE